MALSLPKWNLSPLLLVPGLPLLQNRVVWSLLALTSRCPSGWYASDHTFESCANSSVSFGCASGSDQCRIEPSEPPETRTSS